MVRGLTALQPEPIHTLSFTGVGYALVEVKSKEEALNVARQFMELHRVHWPAFEGECEVRPLEDM